MIIPKGTDFFFSCELHTYQLSGTPKLKNPTKIATAVWEFDLSGMSCDEGLRQQRNNFCRKHWKVRA